MDTRYADPNIGLNEMAETLSISPRRLNHLFRETFNLTPYAYFLYLRIRKAKEHLVHRPELSISDIAALVGFRDTSHFVATFRRHVGHPPEQFRKMH
jgi:AraC-like DNA-binding protein